MSSGQEPRPQIPHPLRGKRKLKRSLEKSFCAHFCSQQNTAPPEEEEEMI